MLIIVMHAQQLHDPFCFSTRYADGILVTMALTTGLDNHCRFQCKACVPLSSFVIPLGERVELQSINWSSGT